MLEETAMITQRVQLGGRASSAKCERSCAVRGAVRGVVRGSAGLGCCAGAGASESAGS